MAAISDSLRTYRAGSFPQLGDERTFLTRELEKLQASLLTLQQVIQKLDTTKTVLLNAANDAAAAAAGVQLNGLYRTGNAVQVRLT
jgi:hypothetical protein